MNSTKKLASLLAELLGTFALTAVVISVSKTYGTPIFTAIAAGTTLAALISALGPVSGGHFNPAITLGFLSVRKIAPVRALLYVAMQVMGAVIAWKVFEWLSPERLIVQSTITEFNYQIFTAEAVGTGIFAMAVAATVFRKLQGGYAAAVAGMGLFAGSVAVAVVIMNRQIVTGILNPAIAFGLGNRAFNGGLLGYTLGPVLGAVVGMLAYKYLLSPEVEVAKVVPAVKAAMPALPAVPTPAKSAVVSAPSKTTTKKAAPKKKTAKKKTSKK